MANGTPSTSTSTFHPSAAAPFESKLSEQLWEGKEQPESTPPEDNNNTTDNNSLEPPQRSSPKSRSLSDAAKPSSSAQPASGELVRASKDDSSLTSSPATPQRSHSAHHALSLHLPPRLFATPGPGSVISRAPLSPKLDSSHIYGSPVSVLPRRSRGLDFSRACTNLHHSTLAESSPDSSPTIGGRGLTIPQRRGGATSSGLASPSTGAAHPFSTSGPADRTTISSSVSSVNMLDSDTTSSDEDDDEPMDGDRDSMMITTTPQVSKMGGGLNPFAPGTFQSPGNDWMGGPSPAAASLMSFQRARYRTRRSRHSSSSASGNSSKPSPGPLSPPVIKSIETSTGGYFSRDLSKSALQSRRESLSLGTRDLQLSDLSDDGESQVTRGSSPAGLSNPEGGPRGVIRRAVTRRGNLLPKTKNFARIRATLMEESAPIDSEAKREAEVIRQVRESDPTIPPRSPVLPPAVARSLETKATEDGAESAANPTDGSAAGSSFSHEAMKNSGGVEFWNSFDERYRTPPPPLRLSGTSSTMEDTAMETPPSSVFGSAAGDRPLDRSRSSTPHASNPPLASELTRKVNKRRRDDDLDPNSFKRRAVSPGMSVQSSPVLPQSPVVRDPSIWSQLPRSTLGALGSSENGGGGSPHTGTIKRVGLQGMNETNDGLMNMSIE